MDNNRKILIGIFAVFVMIGTTVYMINVNKPNNIADKDNNKTQNNVNPYSDNPVSDTQNQQNINNTNIAANTEPAPASKKPVLNLKEIKKKDMTLQQKIELKEPTSMIDISKQYEVILKTSEGDITLELYADKVPNTVNNFVYLASQGFYKDTVFHRVIKDFMIQGGDPVGNGSGGPGYRINDEKFEGDYTRGTIAMARTMAPNSAGSQFFIMHKDVPLPKDYVIFGKVTKGIEVVDKIAEAETTLNEAEGANSKPVKPVKVIDAIVTQK